MTTGVRKPTAVRREAIAKAVPQIIGERGPSALSTTTWAGEIGVTSGALFRHCAGHGADVPDGSTALERGLAPAS